MRKIHARQLLTGLLLAMMFFGLILAVPSGTITTEAQKRYLEEAPAGAEDEYGFLFEEDGE